MQRQGGKANKKEGKKETEVMSLGIKIASILLVFCGLVALISLLYLLSPPRLNAQGLLNIFALSVFPIAYGIWKEKKWAFYASLILLESLIIIYPLIAAFSPYFGIEYNWICLLCFIGVGISVVPIIISNGNNFEGIEGAKAHKFIKNLPVFNLLFVIFGISLIIRTVLPYDTVFKDTVRFASDDAVYHMRLVENALFGDHFPRRLFFDAYTYFPHGNFLHFAPLFDQIIIFASWIIGLGSPTKALMDAVGAYYPAILGALTVFPVYIIGKEICNKYAGLVASLLVAILPGQFLQRSILGFTDHHVGEALFSTIAVMFLVLAVKRAKEELSERDIMSWFAKSPAEWVKNKNFPFLCYAGAILLLFQIVPWEWWVFLSLILFLLALIIFNCWKKPDSYVFYTVLAGMALGFYLLTWVAGLFFVLIFFLFGILQYTINGLRGEPNDYICVTLIPTFFIALLMTIPFFGLSPSYYSIRHVASLAAGVVIFSFPLLYRFLANKFIYNRFIEETPPEHWKVNAKGTYVCPLCGKKTKGIVDHIRIKHKKEIESKGNIIKIKNFFEKNPEFQGAEGLKKLGIENKSIRTEKIAKYDFLLPIVATFIFFCISVVVFPSIMGSFSILTPSGAALTVGEVQPMDLLKAWGMFTTTFFIAFFAMAILAADIAMKNRPEKLLVLVWSIIMLVAMGGLGYVGQVRFAYYYAINAAVLTGFFSARAFEFLSSEKEETKKEKAEVAHSERKKKKKGGKVKKKEATTDTTLLIFAFAIMILFTVGVLQVGIMSIIPLAVIAAIFFFWMHASNKKRKDIEKTLTKTLAVLFIIFIVFYPFPLNAVANSFPSTSNLPLCTAYAINDAKRGIGADEEWYEALRWMRNNTPDTGVDYYALYKEPPLNETTGRREDYKYPPPAYGVMSWWDYGHVITWIAHRIPNANPFQAGAHIAAEYLISTDESKANEILDELGTRYVITDFMMVDFLGAPPHPKYVMPTWTGTNPNPWFTIEARLHFFDGCEEHVEAGAIAPLVHYRLVHESPLYILPFQIIDAETNRPLYWNAYFGNYNDSEAQAQILHALRLSVNAKGVEEDLDNETVSEMLKGVFKTAGVPLSEHGTVTKINKGRWVINDEENKEVYIVKKEEGKLNIYLYGVRIAGQPNMKAWAPDYIEPMGFVKVFEYVKGAKIEGNAPDGSSIVEISTNITTSHGREFVYSQRLESESNGSYEFVVPYSTEGPILGGTNFDVFAAPYKIRAGHLENETVVWDVEKEVSVNEKEVMEGKTKSVDLVSLP